MKNKRRHVSLEAVTHTHTHTHTYVLVNEFLNSNTYFIKIGFNFIEKIIKDKLYKNIVYPFCVAKGVMDTAR